MKSNGVATILLMIPVLTVPALAIFGIPQFAPVVASPIDEIPIVNRAVAIHPGVRKMICLMRSKASIPNQRSSPAPLLHFAIGASRNLPNVKKVYGGWIPIRFNL